jgi:raffinose/stachyose/melibiose transport system substrate-binding protein
MKRIAKLAVLMGMAVSGMAISASATWASSSRKPVVAEPGATVDYSGTLSLLTKFGVQQLSPYFVNAAHAYETLHPGVHVVLDQQTDDSVKDKTKTLVASNSLPDIYFSWTGNWGENFVRGNRAVDLSKVIASDTDWGKTFTPAAVASFVWHGKNYGMPLYLDAKFMGYNKQVFSKLGIGVPKSFDELLSACDTIRKSGMTPISIGNKEAWPAIHYIGQLLAYDVPEATLEKDFNPKTATYTDPGYLAALNQFTALVTRCTDGGNMNGVSFATAIEDFSNLKSAMYYQEIIEFDGSASAQTPLKQSDFGFFVLPPTAGAKGDTKAIEGAPEGYMINTRSKHVSLALDFLKFVTSMSNAQALSAPPYGQPSAVIGAVTDKNSSSSVVAGMVDLNATPFLMPWLDTANTPRVASAWLNGIQALAGGSMPAAQVIEGVAAAAKADADR